MKDYQHILFATDFSPEAIEVGERANDIAQHYKAKLNVIHVIEQVNINVGYELLPMVAEPPERTIVREAHAGLQQLAARMGLAETDTAVVIATTTKEGILRTAREQQVDLIVVGSHGRHGLALLLGSTTDAVLHGASCDVLAVRI